MNISPILGQVTICEKMVSIDKNAFTKSMTQKKLVEWEVAFQKNLDLDSVNPSLLCGSFYICDLPNALTCKYDSTYQNCTILKLLPNGTFINESENDIKPETGFWSFEYGKLIFEMNDSVRIGLSNIFVTEKFKTIAFMDNTGFITYSAYPAKHKWFQLRARYYLKYDLAIKQ